MASSVASPRALLLEQSASERPRAFWWGEPLSRWTIISGNKPKSLLTLTKIKILNIALRLIILPKNVPNYTFTIYLVKKIASVKIFNANINSKG